MFDELGFVVRGCCWCSVPSVFRVPVCVSSFLRVFLFLSRSVSCSRVVLFLFLCWSRLVGSRLCCFCSVCLSVFCVAFRAKRPPTLVLLCPVLGLAVECPFGPSSGQRLSDRELLLEFLLSDCRVLSWSLFASSFFAKSFLPVPFRRSFSGVSCVKEHLSPNGQSPSM